MATAVGVHSSRELRSRSHRHFPPLSSDLREQEKKHLSMAIRRSVFLCRGLVLPYTGKLRYVSEWSYTNICIIFFPLMLNFIDV